MDRWQTFPVSFTGGLQSNISSLEQGIQNPGSAQTLVNFEPSIDGGYRRIRGYTKYDANAIPGSGSVRGVFFHNDAVYVARDTKVYYSGGSGWTELTTSSITLGSGTSTVRFVTFNFDGNESLIILDPGGNALEYKGGTLSRLTGIPTDGSSAQFVEIFKNHVFLGKGRNLVFSSPYSTSDFTTGSGGGVINVSYDITGLIKFRDRLLIFTEHSILQLAGSTVTDFAVSPITDDLGCAFPDTIQEIGGDVMFLAPDGLRLVSGTERNNDFGLAVVSRSIQKEMKELLENHTSFCSVVVPTKSQYRIFGKSAVANSATTGILGLQTAPQGGAGMMWSKIEGMNVEFASSVTDVNNEVIVFTNSSNYVYRMESGNSFDSQNILATYMTPYMPITDPSTRKTLYKVDVFTDPEGSFEVKLDTLIDYNTSGSVQPIQKTLNSNAGSAEEYSLYGTGLYGTATFVEASIDDLFKLNLEGSGKVFAFKFTSEGTSPPVSLNAMSIQYAQHGRR